MYDSTPIGSCQCWCSSGQSRLDTRACHFILAILPRFKPTSNSVVNLGSKLRSLRTDVAAILYCYGCLRHYKLHVHEVIKFCRSLGFKLFAGLEVDDIDEITVVHSAVSVSSSPTCDRGCVGKSIILIDAPRVFIF